MELIKFEDFAKVELKIVKILEASRIDGSDKLLKLKVSLGLESGADLPAVRQVIAGIGKNYEPDFLIGKEIAIVANLEPRMLMGLESQGMILAAKSETGPVVLFPEKEVPPGAGIS